MDDIRASHYNTYRQSERLMRSWGFDMRRMPRKRSKVLVLPDTHDFDTVTITPAGYIRGEYLYRFEYRGGTQPVPSIFLPN